VSVRFTWYNDDPGFESQLVRFFHQRQQQLSQEKVAQMIGAKLLERKPILRRSKLFSDVLLNKYVLIFFH